MSDRSPLLASSVILIEGGGLLLVKRRHPPDQGTWSLPGGRTEEGESLEDTARREVHEELGVAIELGPLIGEHLTDADEEPIYRITCFEGSLRGGAVLHVGSDAGEACFFTREELGTIELSRGLLRFLDNHGVLARLI